MKINIAKYFWDLNKKALKEAEDVFRNQAHPKFRVRLITLLSRCDRPKELFSLITREDFLNVWPKARAYWLKISGDSTYRDWWETIYQQIAEDLGAKKPKPQGSPARLFLKFGKTIKEARIEKGLSQNELALRVGMKQPDISEIEEGRRNITLETLSLLCRALNIKSIELDLN